jgi:hypothetical protein
MGIDLKYGLSSNLTLDATFNPDFGQVESDPANINLSTFETYYSEKRPFFIEGASNFDTDYDLFYSRRIGRAPQGEPDDLDYYVNKPKGTTIIGAGKLTGKTANGWEIGFLNAVTDEERASYVNTDGIKKIATIEEPANYNIARVKKEYETGSSFGFMSTMAHQKSQFPNYTGGIDWNLFVNDRNYSTSGQIVGSRLGPGNNGFGYQLEAHKQGGKHVRGSVWHEYETRDLDLNRLGYQRRGNYQGGGTWWQYRTNDDIWIMRNTYHNINFWWGKNLDGDLISLGGNYNNSIEFKNGMRTGFGFSPDFPHYDDRETRGGPLFKLPYTWAAWVWFQTSNEHPVVVNVNPSWGTDKDGRWANAHMWFEVKPKENLQFSFGPGLRTSNDISRWVENVETDDGESVDVFAELDYRQLDMNIRSTIVFKKNISLVLYSQIFLGAGEYTNYKQFVPYDSYTDLTIPYEGESDFNYKSFNLNAVFRWEYMPGSDLYLVWTQARDRSDDFGDFAFDRDFKDVFDTQSENVFLAKINYWWNP